MKETDYVISMQRALMLFEIGNLLDNGKPQLAQAAKIYAAMETRFPRRAVVKYRYAKVLDASGERPAAITKLREVLGRLDQKLEPLPDHHWIRAAAPRVLGVLLWEEADALGRATGTPQDEWSNRRVALLREAYDVTRAAYDLKVKEEASPSAGLPSERAKAANNLLYYALEFAEAAKLHRQGSDPGVKAAELRRLLKAMGAEDPAQMLDARLLDTARRAYEFLGDLPRARAAALRFLELVESQMTTGGVASVHTEEMIEAAKAVLGRSG